MRCAVFGCNTSNQSKDYKDNKFRLHTFPKDKSVRDMWINACCRADTLNPKSSRICSKHFLETDFVRNLQHELLNYLPKNGPKLKNDAVPTVLLPEGKCEASKATPRKKRMAPEYSKELMEGIERYDSDDKELRKIEPSRGTHKIGRMSRKHSKKLVNTERCDIENSEELMKLHNKIFDLETRNKNLEARNKHLEARNKNLETRNDVLESLFTPEQIKKLTNPQFRPIWFIEAISRDITLYSTTP